MKLADLPQIMALSLEEKLSLIQELQASIESDEHISEEEKNLLDERWENFLKNPDSALTVEQCKSLLAARRR